MTTNEVPNEDSGDSSKSEQDNEPDREEKLYRKSSPLAGPIFIGRDEDGNLYF